MPIFVQWKWKEQTKTFLAIFYFYDNGTKPNLRMKMYGTEFGFETIHPLKNEKKGEFVRSVTLPGWLVPPSQLKTYMTWSPSHPEFCFLTEVLTYANLINGLDKVEKRNLRPKLEGRTYRKAPRDELEIHIELVKAMPEGKIVVFAEGGICCEVCLEYIDYLRKVLKPYLS